MRQDPALVRSGLKTISKRFKTAWTPKTYATPSRVARLGQLDKMLPKIRSHLVGHDWLLSDWGVAWMSLAWHHEINEAFSIEVSFLNGFRGNCVAQNHGRHPDPKESARRFTGPFFFSNSTIRGETNSSQSFWQLLNSPMGASGLPNHCCAVSLSSGISIVSPTLRPTSRTALGSPSIHHAVPVSRIVE